MQNKDARNAALNQFRQNFRTGLENKDFDQVASALQVYADSLVNNLTDAAQEFQKTSDEAILARAGVRPVPSEVKAWYDGIVKAFSAEEPRQALTGVDKTIPEFVIDTVLSDINNNHPLLAALDVVNTRGNTKYIIAKDKHQLAQWGKLTAAITKELEGTIEEGHFGQDKLTAFLPVPKDLLKLGASYINAYIVKILSDALACGFEFGAIKGTGKDMPIGAVKNLDGAVVQGEYPDKEAIPVASFDIKTFMTLVAMLAEKPKYAGEAKGRPRKVTKVALIVNPSDFLTKVIPATTVLATDGSYKNNVFPFPTEVFPTEELDEGEALFGIMEDGKIKYKLFLSTGIGGNIEYSDDYQFLEDNRVYAIKLLGTGRPDDNNCFIKLDISGLVPLTLNVNITGSVATVATDAQLLSAVLNKTTVEADDTAKVAVASVGYNITPDTAPTLTYQWQVRAKTGTNWADLDNTYTGYNSAELTVKAADAEKHYRCKVTASGSAVGTVNTGECTVAAAS